MGGFTLLLRLPTNAITPGQGYVTIAPYAGMAGGKGTVLSFIIWMILNNCQKNQGILRNWIFNL
jgi:hypothetical protein